MTRRISSFDFRGIARPLALVSSGMAVVLHPSDTLAATLPQPCLSGTCGIFVASGQASATVQGNTLTLNQSSSKAILNWNSFDISAEGSVIFKQSAGSGSIALNRIFSANPTQIFGKLTANGQVYLINQNGFVFGSGASVNTGGFLASTLAISDSVFDNGLLTAMQAGAATGQQYALAQAGSPATISIQPGAKLTTNAAGQRILLAAKNIDNAGSIDAVGGGQVVLAAGEKVYLAASTDEKLRGLLVEVDGGGSVVNTGSVTAEHGNVTAVGLAINQNGRVSASTSVAENGSIRLLARDSVRLKLGDDGLWGFQSTLRGGQLTVGAGSSTRVDVDAASTALATDDQVQLPSTVELAGREVNFLSGSNTTAHGGQVSVTAASNPDNSRDTPTSDTGARITVAQGATIDVSGNTAQTSVTRNLVTVELRSNELADSPLQRGGELQGKTVVVDARVGTPIANVSGALGLIQRDVLERTSAGGSVLLDSAGSLTVSGGSVIDVSGGAVDYAGGAMRTTQLIRADGSVVDIGKASPSDSYIGIVTPSFRQVSDRWGVVQQIAAPGLGQFEPGYVDGKSAGSLQVLAHQMVLDGTFLGHVTAGLNQRTAGTLPLGGQFLVGDSRGLLSYRAPEIVLFAPGAASAPASRVSTAPDAPLSLSTEIITKGGFSRVYLASDRAITLSSGSDLTLAPDGLFALVAPKLSLASNIVVPSGSVDLTARALQPAGEDSGLFVGSGVGIDVSGVWVNDFLPPQDQPSAPVLINGGTIKLAQRVDGGTLSIGGGVSLLADGGAWLKQNRTLVSGAGGGISILSPVSGQLGSILSVGQNLHVEAFGVQGAAGGSFSLQAPRLDIGSSRAWLIPQTISGSVYGGALRLGTQLFSDFGFAKFTLLADGLPRDGGSSSPTLNVSPGTVLALSVQTNLLDPEAISLPSATSLHGLATTTLQPSYLRSPISLSLQALPTFGLPSAYGALQIGQNAVISADPGSSITLQSRGDLRVAGSILVPGGTLGLSILTPPSDQDQSYVARTMSLAGTGVLDVSGTVVYRPNDADLVLGTVYGGGKIGLRAQTGSVLLDAGSRISFAGTAANLDVSTGVSDPHYVNQLVTTAGGDLSISAAEGVALLGELNGRGGAGASAQDVGGTLKVAVTRSLPSDRAATFPVGPRFVELAATAHPPVVNGSALLGVDTITRSGVGSLTLAADDRIVVDAGVNLALKQALVLDAPALAVAGSGLAHLSADYIAAGPQLSVVNRSLASAGTGSLALDASRIDVVGSLALQNVSVARFNSAGDLQMLGYDPYPTALGGQLASAGDLFLTAQRILPTTGSVFQILGTGADSTITFNRVGSSDAVPLSVAGNLTVTAPNIVQGGAIFSPFGSISLDASRSLQLTAGSLTSVSANGSILPYGRVDNGNSWLYGVDPTNPSAVSAVPGRAVSLNGRDVTLATGATVDISGGGDLLAYQFTPGTGGTRDVLAGGALPGTYAILPGAAAQSVPYDPMMWANSGLTPGQSVYLAPGSGVSAGVYALLPARYALLPGAYLVTPAASGFRYMSPGSVGSTSDGAAVVAGYRSYGNQTNAVATFTGFEIRSGAYARKLAQYEDRLASEFFALQPLSPADAGTLRLTVSRSLDVAGRVLAAAASGGGRANIEIAAPNLQITQNGGSADPGSVVLSAAVLDGWSAGQLLLGGTRDASGAIVVASSAVKLMPGAQLSADEVILAATDKVEVAGGASLSTTSSGSGNTPGPLGQLSETLNLGGSRGGDAALLSVSNLGSLQVRRSSAATGTPGNVTVAPDAVIATRGAMAADAGGAVILPGSAVRGAPQSVWLGASHVTLGAASLQPGGLSVDSALLGVLNSARVLGLRSATSINLANGVGLGTAAGHSLDVLSLTAAGLSATDPLGNVTIAAGTVQLHGLNVNAGALSSGAGTLAVKADQLIFSDGQIGISGYGQAVIDAAAGVDAVGFGGVAVAGDLVVRSPLVTVTSGASSLLESRGGNVSLLAPAQAAAATVSPGYGGHLSVQGRDVAVSTQLVLRSGEIALTASNDLQIQNTARIDVSGAVPVGSSLGSDGGVVSFAAGRDVLVQSGSVIDVSAAPSPDAYAGSITVVAGRGATLSGTVSGKAGATAGGGSFALTAASVSDLSGLNSRLQANGFGGTRSFELTSGDLVMGLTDAIDARHIRLVADAGSIRLAGRLTALSTEERSDITLAASGDILVSGTATIAAQSVDPTQYRGGVIDIGTTGGRVAFDAASAVTANGYGQSGMLVLRAPASATDFALSSLPRSLTAIDHVVLEPLRQYTLATATPSAATFSAIRTDLSGYVAGARTATLSRLGLSSLPGLYYTPFADIVRTGNLTLPALDFSAWRFGNQPAAVAIRATGTLTVNGTVGDGFSGSGSTLDLLNTSASGLRSSSLTLVAGANLAAAESTATLKGLPADLILVPNAVLRTGTGNLTLAAARDIVLGSGAKIYTGGVKAANSVSSSVGRTTYPEQGGSIALSAGRDVLGTAVTQSSNDWQIRSPYTTPSGAIGAYWGIDFSTFGWNLGALAGGDVSVVAGRNVRDLSATVADSVIVNRATGVRTALGGGNLDVAAGGDIASGYFYVARGTGALNAQGGLTASGTRREGSSVLGSLLLSGDSSYRISALGDILLEGEIPAFGLVPTNSADDFETDPFVFFNRYGASTFLAVRSEGGALTLANRPATFLDDSSIANSDVGTKTQPTAQLAAFGGDLSASLSGMSSPSGQLQLYAYRNITRGNVLLSDVSASTFSATSTSNDSAWYSAYQNPSLDLIHAADLTTATVTAGRDIVGLNLELPKAVDVIAGRDVLDLLLVAQHAGGADTTSVIAGRDILNRSSIQAGITSAKIQVGGPGRLEVVAGRNIDLEYSVGVSTVGDLLNPNLATPDGASIYMLAGLTAPLGLSGSASADFLNQVVAPNAAFSASLVDYMAQNGGSADLSFAEAARLFRALPLTRQLPWVSSVLFQAVVASGREATADPVVGFTKGYAAVSSLFPGSNPSDSTLPNAYSGNISLPYSRIYTLAGGGITLLAPGGKIDVGLATPPTGLAKYLSRGPSDLGIVAEGAGAVDILASADVNVNASRIFTLGGGDIAIWSNRGNIDAGKGAKSALSAPPPVLLVDAQGNVRISVASSVAGSGIRTIQSGDSVGQGNVDLLAPAGFVNAGDAGIGSAGNLTIAAQRVVGLDNIQVGGSSAGVPAETSGVGISLSGASTAGNSSSSASSSSTAGSQSQRDVPTGLGQATLSFLDVFVLGLGDETCKVDDMECLKRQKTIP